MWKKLFRKFLVGVVLTAVGIGVPVLGLVREVKAISEEDLYYYAQNGIYFYNPENNACMAAGVGAYDGVSSAGLTELQAAFVDSYHEMAEKLSVAYGIPWETVIAQGILESTTGTSDFAVNRNNFFGIGAYDSNPDAAFYYDSVEEGWRGYYENIRKTATYRQNGVFRGEAITDPHAYLRAIKAAGYATDPYYVEKLDKIIAAIENRAIEKGWKSSAELASAYPEMLTHAAEYAEGGGEAGATLSTCVYVAAGNGDINATAIDLSWADNTHLPTDPNPAYAEALVSTGVNKLGDICSMGGYSCDAFLSTVMRYSGADEGFPCCGAAMQLNYLSTHPDLYAEIENIGNTSNLQPGDIRANGTHVEIVVQLADGAYKIASASHCDRTGDHASDYYAGAGYRIFRRKA